MSIIITSIILLIYANVIRWAELADNTYVRNFSDYIIYNNYITVKYNLLWILITSCIYLTTFVK